MKLLLLSVALVLGLAACAGSPSAPEQASRSHQSPQLTSLPEDAARAERKAYAECAVRKAFSVPLPEPHAVDALVRVAVGVCEPLRRAVFAQLVSEQGGVPEAGELASAYIRQVDAALASRLGLRLREAVLQREAEVTSGSSI